MHASGVHATVAGVLLGFTVPVVRRAAGPGPGLAEHLEHRFRPLSAGVAVPVFAFFASGVSLADAGGLGASLVDPITTGIIAALVVGKTVGVFGATWLVQRFTRAQLAPELGWWDVLGLSLLGGIGFTVSLLIGELAFGAGSDQDNLVKIGVLVGSGTAAMLAAVILRIRDRRYRAICAEEAMDDRDSTLDVDQDGSESDRPADREEVARCRHGCSTGGPRTRSRPRRRPGCTRVALIGLRLSPRRTLSQWTAIDVAAAVALGAIIGRTAIAQDQSLAVGAAALLAILAAHFLLTVCRMHPRVAGLVDRRVKILVDHGRLCPSSCGGAG